jgi:hypothetical protein
MQAYNMNYWIEKVKNEELFIRFDGEEVGANTNPWIISRSWRDWIS